MGKRKWVMGQGSSVMGHESWGKMRGFSLSELMVVVGIIAVVGAVSAGSVSVLQKNSRDAQRQGDLGLIKGALQQFYADNNFYPNTLDLTGGAALNNCTGSTCSVSATRTYLQTTPKDPVPGTTTPYCYGSQLSSTVATSCTSVSNPGKCHFYKLHAMLENPESGAVSSACGSANYNFVLTPL